MTLASVTDSSGASFEAEAFVVGSSLDLMPESAIQMRLKGL